MFAEKRTSKVVVLPATRDELGDNAIVRLQAKAAAWLGVRRFEADKSPAPGAQLELNPVTPGDKRVPLLRARQGRGDDLTTFRQDAG